MSPTTSPQKPTAVPPPYKETIQQLTMPEKQAASAPVANASVKNAPFGHREIEGTTIPQWTWSHSQCKAWLFAVTTQMHGLEEAKALEIIRNFQGVGATLYGRISKGWKRFGFSLNVAWTIYNLLLSWRPEQGAVPKSIHLPFGWWDKKLNRRKKIFGIL